MTLNEGKGGGVEVEEDEKKIEFSLLESTAQPTTMVCDPPSMSMGMPFEKGVRRIFNASLVATCRYMKTLRTPRWSRIFHRISRAIIIILCDCF